MKYILSPKHNEYLLKQALHDDSAHRTAQSLYKIIQFLLYRVSSKKKFMQRIRGKLIRTSPLELGSKKMPMSATIGQSVALIKNILNGLDPAFISKVLAELNILLGA